MFIAFVFKGKLWDYVNETLYLPRQSQFEGSCVQFEGSHLLALAQLLASVNTVTGGLWYLLPPFILDIKKN